MEARLAKFPAPPEANGALATRVREELARRRWSREALAEKARVSVSTLEKGLSGQRPFTLATVVRLEAALGLSLRAVPLADPAADAGSAPGAASMAPDELGSYTRASVSWLERDFLTLVPSFSEPGAIHAYRTSITWSEPETRLKFRESNRHDAKFEQFGDVAVPFHSGHVYLHTNRHGQMRLAVLARPVITGELHGLLTTLLSGRGAHLSPVSAPMVLKAIGPGDTPAFGRVRKADAAYDLYRQLLRRTLHDGFAALLSE